MTGILYIVATPIGNLGDTTKRAIDILKDVDFVFCEDTRVTKKLLNHFEINTPVDSYHQHSSTIKSKKILDILKNGQSVALVTDAGTPGVSDPGNELVDYIRNNSKDIQIIPIPGASAVTTALSVSGFPTDKFVFLGFPPHKNKRKKFFEEVGSAKYTVVLYESSHRIQKAIKDLSEVLDKDFYFQRTNKKI
jgi:16S rRNA (cytidine1402-2'-O)-methyltransferase